MHAPAGQGRPERPPDRPEQPAPVARREFVHRPGRVNLRPPEDLIGEQVADAGDGLLIKQPCLDRCRAPGEHGPELRRRDRLGVRPELLDGRVETNPAEAARVDEQQRAAVGERQAEAGEPVVSARPAAFPVVAAVDLVTAPVRDHDLAGHAEMDSERRTRRAGAVVRAGSSAPAPSAPVPSAPVQSAPEVSHQMLFPRRCAAMSRRPSRAARISPGRCGLHS